LIEEARAGSSEAKGALFAHHHPAAWRTALAITRSPDLADDVAQESLVVALERLADHDGRGTFAAWLHRIVANRSLNALRARPTVELHDGPDAASSSHTLGVDPALRRAFDHLSAEQRAMLVLRFWFDLKPGEIAEALDLPAGTVYSRLSRALAILRDHLDREELSS
jgi:RNA polymerase sigma-70 factor (ECF subfamily)